MSGMDRHSELQQHKTAAEYRQAADEHVRTLKDFWKDFLVSGLFVLAATLPSLHAWPGLPRITE